MKVLRLSIFDFTHWAYSHSQQVLQCNPDLKENQNNFCGNQNYATSFVDSQTIPIPKIQTIPCTT